LKEDLRFVLVGHVDHGKSTLIGRLLFDTNSLPLDRVEEARQAALGVGKELELAFLLDHFQEEREQAITIDTTQIFFKTDARNYVIIDAPGHVEFLKNMITGASQAEAAILIVDVSQGVQTQTRRHAYLLSLLGLREVLVVINKMDLLHHSSHSFQMVKREVSNLLNSIGIDANFYIPISAKDGDNVATPSRNTDWYRGPTVLEALDSLQGKDPPEHKSLIFPIQDVYQIDGKNIAVGRIEAGVIREGEMITILPKGQITNVKSIEKYLEQPHVASAGESIGITTQNPTSVDRGCIICEPSAKPSLTDRFQANIFWMAEDGIEKGEKVTLRCATQEVFSQMEGIKVRVDSSSLKIIEEDPSKLGNLEVGKVIIKTESPIAIKRFEDVQELGRFILARGEDVCAGGIITKIENRAIQ
jgi:sulfate adenylyltransferase large subunit